LALSEAPFPTAQSETFLASFSYHRFATALSGVGFEVETATHWPKAAPGDYWLFFHASPIRSKVADQVKTIYHARACASTVVFNLLYPHGFAAVSDGIALSVGQEAYGHWLRGEVPEPDKSSFVITTRQRAIACGLRTVRAKGEAVMLAGGTTLPELLWRCLSA
jgi:hypothetical protein